MAGKFARTYKPLKISVSIIFSNTGLVDGGIGDLKRYAEKKRII